MPNTTRWAVPDNLPQKMFIDGQWVASSSARMIETIDPATGTVIGRFPDANNDDVDRAVSSARAALSGEWRTTTPTMRGRILSRTAALIRKDAERLACIETLESGKPIREARGDIETAAGYFEYYAGIADKLQGDSIPLGPDFMSFTLHEPVGVTAHIIPWNFPLVTTARGAAPALAAGCTAVIKPAEQTSLTSLILADILLQAGLPTGVCNVITGYGAESGAALTAHPDVSHVTFTGSVPTGKTVMKTAADHVASVTLELGGKSPLVVLADADLDAAVEGTLKAIYLNAGQVCSAGSRLVVDRKVHAAMMERLVPASEAMALGHGLDDAQLGPLISAEQLKKVADYVDGAKARSISVATGGRIGEVADMEGGFFYTPTILDNVPTEEKVVQEEIFGPVLCVQVVDSPEQAIAVANGTDFGLVAGIYTRDISRALEFARDVDSGQVFINQYFAGGIGTPFGGTKQSGFGREKGLAAMASYYRVKCITARLT
ncbi:MAG: aldehyde dehydrogenase family protein [Gammaproteobacteria bacterium]|nr:aldehyde dehydrogenase family protein [Gammaproteobacteria bacterium]